MSIPSLQQPASAQTTLFEDIHSGKARLPSVEALRAERMRRDFKFFVKEMWSVIDPAKLEWNWHMDVICDALMKISHRTLKGLVIAVPPGTSKSILVSVLHPAWEWLPGNWPESQSMYLSGTGTVCNRDSGKCRTVLESEEYQQVANLLAEVNGSRMWTLTVDQNQKTWFTNTLNGSHQAVSLGQRYTGLRGTKLVVDDPADVEEVLMGSSERIAERMAEIVEAYDKKLLSRRNDLRSDPIVIIAQRLHCFDLPGVVMSRNEPGYQHIVLPLEYDPDIAVPEDPRRVPGEVLDKVRFTPVVVEDIRRKLQEQYHAQYNQRPVPAEGGMFKLDWFKRTYKWVGDQPGERGYVLAQQMRPAILPRFHRRILSVDCANKAKELSDPTVFSLWGQDDVQDVYLLAITKDKLAFPALYKMTQKLIRFHDPDVFICEDQGNGIALIPMIQEMFPGLTTVPIPAVKEKDIRASNTTHWWEAGRVHVPDDNSPFMVSYREEHLLFPNGDNDDQVDSTSQALQYLHDHRSLFRHRVIVGDTLIEATGDPDRPNMIYEPERGRFVHVLDHCNQPENYRQKSADQGALMWGALTGFRPGDDE